MPQIWCHCSLVGLMGQASYGSPPLQLAHTRFQSDLFFLSQNATCFRWFMDIFAQVFPIPSGRLPTFAGTLTLWSFLLLSLASSFPESLPCVNQIPSDLNNICGHTNSEILHMSFWFLAPLSFWFEASLLFDPSIGGPKKIRPDGHRNGLDWCTSG